MYLVNVDFQDIMIQDWLVTDKLHSVFESWSLYAFSFYRFHEDPHWSSEDRDEIITTVVSIMLALAYPSNYLTIILLIPMF